MVLKNEVNNVVLYPWEGINAFGKIGYLDSGGLMQDGVCDYFLYKNAMERIDLYDGFARADLDRFSALVISAHIDEVCLYGHRQRIMEFLDRGKMLVSFMSNFTRMLPFCSQYIQSTMKIVDRSVRSDHRIFHGITEYDLNYRRGVKGFFNRGFFDISGFPDTHNLEVILTDNEGKCAGYIDRDSTRGVILATACADLLGYGIFDNNTSRRMGLNLLRWMQDTMVERKAMGACHRQIASGAESGMSDTATNGAHKANVRILSRSRNGEEAGSGCAGRIGSQGGTRSARGERRLRNAIITGGSNFHHYFFINQGAKYADFFDEVIYALDVDEYDLGEFDYVVIASRVNPDILVRCKNKFVEYLDGGGNIVSFGEVVKVYLPGIVWKNYPVNFWWWVFEGADLPMYADEQSSLFSKICIEDAKWHYHGVFYPHGKVQKLIVNELDECILYRDMNYRGNLFVTTLDPEFHIGLGFMDKTGPFFDNFMEYVEEIVEESIRKQTIKGGKHETIVS